MPLFVGEFALAVEFLRSIGNHHFGAVDGVHIQENEALAQMILGAGAAMRINSSAHDRHRLPFPPYGRDAQSMAFLNTPGIE